MWLDPSVPEFFQGQTPLVCLQPCCFLIHFLAPGPSELAACRLPRQQTSVTDFCSPRGQEGSGHVLQWDVDISSSCWQESVAPDFCPEVAGLVLPTPGRSTCAFEQKEEHSFLSPVCLEAEYHYGPKAAFEEPGKEGKHAGSELGAFKDSILSEWSRAHKASGRISVLVSWSLAWAEGGCHRRDPLSNPIQQDHFCPERQLSLQFQNNLSPSQPSPKPTKWNLFLSCWSFLQ